MQSNNRPSPSSIPRHRQPACKSRLDLGRLFDPRLLVGFLTGRGRPVLFSLFAAFSLSACVSDGPVHEVDPPQPLELYGEDLQTLDPEDCGRCHGRIFRLIKTAGGKHRIDCKACHQEFHVYRPGKNTYEEIMPKCETCHEEVHGPELARCLDCHSEPHAPKDIPAGRSLEHGCYVCHPELDREMKTHVTQHTELYCHSCHHSRHGYVPECQECHRPHSEGMTQQDCLDCHPPHKALNIEYPEDIASETCVGCHRNEYMVLKQTPSKHLEVECADCHPTHGAARQCRDCHEQPHGEELLERFRICGKCHGPAHSVVLK